MKKKIIQIRDYPLRTVGESEKSSDADKTCRCELFFEDGSSIVAASKECDGQVLRIGDEIFIYTEVNIISLKPLSPQEIKRIIRWEKAGNVIIIILALLTGIMAASW